MLPGTNRAADRFARGVVLHQRHPAVCRPAQRPWRRVFSVMRNVSVPRGISTPGQPNISSTIWRTVSDQKNKIYYFEDTPSPSLIWVRLNQVDFTEGSGVRKLTMYGNLALTGDQTGNFRDAQPFAFLAPH